MAEDTEGAYKERVPDFDEFAENPEKYMAEVEHEEGVEAQPGADDVLGAQTAAQPAPGETEELKPQETAPAQEKPEGEEKPTQEKPKEGEEEEAKPAAEGEEGAESDLV